MKRILTMCAVILCATIIGFSTADAVATKLLLLRSASWVRGDLFCAPANPMTSGKYATRIAAVATGNALISGGVASDPTWGKIGLTTHVSGVLPPANGGTGSALAPIIFTNTALATKAGDVASGAITITGNGSLTIPVSALEEGDTIPFHIAGFINSDADGTEAITLLLKNGATNLLSSGLLAYPATLTSTFYVIDGQIKVEEAGAAGVLVTTASINFLGGFTAESQGRYTRSTAQDLSAGITLTFEPNWTGGDGADSFGIGDATLMSYDSP